LGEPAAGEGRPGVIEQLFIGHFPSKVDRILRKDVDHPEGDWLLVILVVSLYLLLVHLAIIFSKSSTLDRLCGPVVTVLGHRSRGPGLDSRHYHIF
jgi:hypothetical protein